MALSDAEKEVIAYHEAGHAVCAAVLPTADPVHKVTILPMGMALGLTQQLPMDEKHIYRQDYIQDSLVVRMGGRCAEELVFGVISTGANNDLVGATELARKMVSEWGMSRRVGPMAWGSQGQVFLGEDLMHTRDYSDETARVIDEEVERILREQEDRCRSVLRDHRGGLDLVARALLEHETIEGTEVDRLIALAANGDGGDGSGRSDSPSDESHADAGSGAGAGNGSPAAHGHGNGGEQAPERSPLGERGESRASTTDEAGLAWSRPPYPRPPAPPT
jgi:cell division protease FtsH